MLAKSTNRRLNSSLPAPSTRNPLRCLMLDHFPVGILSTFQSFRSDVGSWYPGVIHHCSNDTRSQLLPSFLRMLMLLVLTSPSLADDYGLPVGTPAPQISTADVTGKPFSLTTQLKEGPVVLVFYRGGWCPYCNLQLRRLEQNLVPKLKKHRATIVAISVDPVEKGLSTNKMTALSFVVLSDPQAKILGNYRVQYRLPDNLLTSYKNNYDIDFKKDTRGIIAVPAVYVINSQGKITYTFIDEDYKIRAPSKEVLSAVQLAATKN